MKKINDTQLTASKLYHPVYNIITTGQESIITIDSSGGDVDYVPSPTIWRQGVVSNIVINNSTGANNINLTPINVPLASVRARYLQEILSLSNVGDVAVLNIVKTGNGTASVSVEDVEIIRSGSFIGKAVITATNTTPLSESISIKIDETIGPNTVDTLTNKDLSSLTNSSHQEYYIKYGSGSSLEIPSGGSGTTLTDSVYNSVAESNGTAISYNNGTFTINRRGVYLVVASGLWTTNRVSTRFLRIRNNSFLSFDDTIYPNGSGIDPAQSVSAIMLMEQGETVSALAYHDIVIGGGAAENFTAQAINRHCIGCFLLFALPTL